ncbi:heme ABC transporter ATP-binding protein [Halonatronum saccharophilum]|uniref:heme ABC transporter ATP-binding protein n=1 Tax=Halonatronum saccharophilum TaxID=150060 RepID=UPI0004B0C737|nr:heme ABC transporter ATP-binding protein [Halonatronum saccharophilum]
MNIVEVEDLTFSYGEEKILRGVNFKVSKGEIFGIIGPNGSGKSTLLKLLARGMKGYKGKISLLAKDLNFYKQKDLAKRVGVLPQRTEVSFNLSVEEVVEMGRHPYVSRWRGMREEDMDIVLQSLETTNTLSLKDKSINDISGGERQRVLLARVLAQGPNLLLLDEPTSALDINYQLEIFSLLKKLKSEGRTIIIILHDLNLASNFCDRVLLLDKGNVKSIGEPKKVITSDNIKDVYGCKVGVELKDDNFYIVYG